MLPYLSCCNSITFSCCLLNMIKILQAPSPNGGHGFTPPVRYKLAEIEWSKSFQYYKKNVQCQIQGFCVTSSPRMRLSYRPICHHSCRRYSVGESIDLEWDATLPELLQSLPIAKVIVSTM